MPDDNGYPTGKELLRIREWDQMDPKGLLAFVQTLWWPDDGLFKVTGKSVLRVEIHTSGWSGNESIIQVLEQTWMWMHSWEKSVRGGHYWLKVPAWLWGAPCTR